MIKLWNLYQIMLSFSLNLNRIILSLILFLFLKHLYVTLLIPVINFIPFSLSRIKSPSLILLLLFQRYNYFFISILITYTTYIFTSLLLISKILI
ncbi:Hypothetical protein CKL_3662 [Clostridium kluyveri DSM 555]|uniref:Uncharacterized protein n=1 Tax=Clostridium kluyveri (strain ATCC 8527 / DSM 555 / NBRC 12016 / NCIMB 10680 / K1) TaxID=431943 RepID=A5N3F6_CLOK5|nr:Hypothetical protein CKL_3662 [Clostridium kluyveri DSM 555]